ncbi:hypothetical protein ABEB36_015060 [Hypothenemus hampei]|uniref:Uncharacterized protein n=1 Tax=Hypothenemus hampei TaxID=57062 RepID=A0ABD1E2D1_HYPHA
MDCDKNIATIKLPNISKDTLEFSHSNQEQIHTEIVFEENTDTEENVRKILVIISFRVHTSDCSNFLVCYSGVSYGIVERVGVLGGVNNRHDADTTRHDTTRHDTTRHRGVLGGDMYRKRPYHSQFQNCEKYTKHHVLCTSPSTPLHSTAPGLTKTSFQFVYKQCGSRLVVSCRVVSCRVLSCRVTSCCVSFLPHPAPQFTPRSERSEVCTLNEIITKILEQEASTDNDTLELSLSNQEQLHTEMVFEQNTDTEENVRNI